MPAKRYMAERTLNTADRDLATIDDMLADLAVDYHDSPSSEQRETILGRCDELLDARLAASRRTGR